MEIKNTKTIKVSYDVWKALKKRKRTMFSFEHEPLSFNRVIEALSDVADGWKVKDRLYQEEIKSLIEFMEEQLDEKWESLKKKRKLACCAAGAVTGLMERSSGSADSL